MGRQSLKRGKVPETGGYLEGFRDVEKDNRMTERPKVCPVCGHRFQGNGWDGIDAHWRAHHDEILPYEKAWPLIQAIGDADVPELDDPEASYRRGYQQGAYAAVEAIKTAPISNVRHWVDSKLARWRYLDRPHDRFVAPPVP